MDGSLELPLAQHSLILPFAVDLPISLLGTKVSQIHKLADFASSLQLLRRTSYQTLQAWDRVRQAICCDIDGPESPFASATTCSVPTSSKLLCSTSVGSELRSHRLSSCGSTLYLISFSPFTHCQSYRIDFQNGVVIWGIRFPNENVWY